jgi:mono/diheme cytochrome c family protein
VLGGPAGGTWHWSRSPEEEKAVAASLFNRYCIRCHGIDGRGVWDIPGIPNFTNVRFQASRSDDQLARAIMQGRGAVMPPFRGVLTLEEAWALARYARSFMPGTEISRPGDNEPVKADSQPAPALPSG